MSKPSPRSLRVADLVQRELAQLIRSEMNVSRLGLITVSTVDISPDLTNARVFITCLGAPEGVDSVIAALNEQAGHFRHELAQVLTLRGVPRLEFVYDASVERGSRLSALIDSLHKETRE